MSTNDNLLLDFLISAETMFQGCMEVIAVQIVVGICSSEFTTLLWFHTEDGQELTFCHLPLS